MTVEIEERTDGSHALVVVVGRLDGAGAQTLEARITAMAARGDTRVVLDCARMTYLNSVGVRALLICARCCRRAGGSFTVCALHGVCRTVVEVSGLLPYLDHHDVNAAGHDAADGAAGSGPGSDPRGRAAMTIEERRDGEAVLLSLAGRLEGAGASMLEARVSALVAGGNSRLVLDCSSMTYINSTGLRALLLGARACRMNQGKLAVAALRPACRLVMDMSGFLSVIEYHETSEAAILTMG